LNLQCADSFEIGLLGSAYFAGMALMMLFVTRLGDVLGRKWPTDISTLISVPITVGLLFSENLWLSIGLLFIFGATCPGREQVAFVYMCELVPEKSRNIIGSLLLFVDGTTVGILALYFRFVSKNWLYFMYGSILLNLIGSLGLLFMVPESPKYKHSKGLFREAKDLLGAFARVNGVKDEEKLKKLRFVEET
jgi:MFS family permease